MKITLTSVIVDDQSKALDFYTEKLGFVVKHDIPLGEARWLTVISPEGHADVELLLEPNKITASQVFQKALFDQHIPLTAFTVADVAKEYARLRALAVEFCMDPTDVGAAHVAVFNDTCGNWIQIFAPK